MSTVTKLQAQPSELVMGPVIARGGMAEIIVGSRRSGGFSKVVAIKKILPHFANDPEFLRMLQNEANLCARLHHANIVQVQEFIPLDQTYALIMEFVAGSDLRGLLAALEKSHQKLAVPAAVYICAEIAQGLHYAHTLTSEHGSSLNVIHRDVSPQNILISWDGEVKVIDFGIAESKARRDETMPGVVKGKYSYMSPEQVAAKPLDRRTDIFSLGVVLWEALAMRRLFSSDNEFETIKLVAEAKINGSLSQYNPEVRPSLQAIVEKALRLRPDDRFQTMAEFSVALRRFHHSHYPNWTQQDLGILLRRTMEKRRNMLEEAVRSVSSQSHVDSLRESAISRHSMSASRTMHSGNAVSASELNRASKKNYSQSMIAKIAFTAPARRLGSYSRGVSTWGLISGLSALVVLIGAVLFYTLPKSPQAPTYKFKIATDPEFVLVSVDGVPMFEGRYIRTPLNISMAEGSHAVTLTREGFERTSIAVSGKPGDVITHAPVRLTQLNDVRFANVELMAAGDYSEARVFVDRGQYYGRLPGKVSDLIVGREYTMVVDPGRGNERFRCRIPVRERDAGRQVEVLIDLRDARGKCIFKVAS